MDKADLYKIYQLGLALAPLKTLSGNATVGDAWGMVWTAQRVMQEFVSAASPAKIDVCRADALALAGAIDHAYREHFADKDGNHRFPENKALSFGPYHVWQIQDTLKTFEAVFRAEMQVACAYWVPKKGTYSTTELVNHADGCFPSELLDTIGEMGLSEYRAAGKCFAFGLYSATGYHACRAVEAVLRKYYQHCVGKPSGDTMQWGQMLGDLEKVEKAPKPTDKTMAYIKHVKDHDRNPLSHTRVVLDEQDADGLLKFASIVMVAMAREMKPVELALTEKLKLVAEAL
jgi:hypothetical protein